MRLSNPGAHTAHTVAGDVTGDVRAPLAFAAQPLGADHFLNFTATGGEPDRRSRAKLDAAVISDSGSWALRQPPNRERRQLSTRADTVTLVARAAELRRFRFRTDTGRNAACQMPSWPGRPSRVRSNLRLASPPGPGSGFSTMRGHPGRARHVSNEQGVA